MAHNMMVAVAQITENLARHVRARQDPEKIAEYAEAIKAGAEFPRIDVFRKPDSMPAEYILADGDKRLEAYKLLKKGEIPVTLHEGTPTDAMLWAAKANATHGEPRSHADKRRAVRMLLERPEWWKKSDRTVGTAAMVSHHLVADVRQEMTPIEQPKQVYRENKRGKLQKVKKRKAQAKPEAQAPRFDFRGFKAQAAAVVQAVDDIATRFPEEEKTAEYKLAKRSADQLLTISSGWEKRLSKVRAPEPATANA